MINVKKLDKELKDAGIPIDGCNSSGVISFKSEATQQHKDMANQILTNHNPVWYVEQRMAEYPSVTDQLDMIYKDKVNNTTMWQDLITSIKNKYPK